MGNLCHGKKLLKDPDISKGYMKKIKRHKSCNSIKLTKNPSPQKQRHTLTARACPLLSGVSREPLACCVSWGQKDDMMMCATARDRAGGPEATSCFSNHPAAWLNLQSCSVVRLKDAAWRANLEVAWCDLIFLLGWWKEESRRLGDWLDSLNVLWG